MIFARREPFAWAARTRAEAERFDRYLEGRKRHKAELMDALAGAVTTGPVLEAGNGFGAYGVELLERTGAPLYAWCADPWARRLYRRKLHERGHAGRCRLVRRRPGDGPAVAVDGETADGPPGAFEVVFSVNCLHEWERPAEVLREAYALLRPGGVLAANDLRRDADPFITEYVLREMAAEESDEGRFRLDVFLRSLRSAWSAEELREAVEGAGLGAVEVDTGEAMTVTLWIRKRG